MNPAIQPSQTYPSTGTIHAGYRDHKNIAHALCGREWSSHLDEPTHRPLADITCGTCRRALDAFVRCNGGWQVAEPARDGDDSRDRTD